MEKNIQFGINKEYNTTTLQWMKNLKESQKSINNPMI